MKENISCFCEYVKIYYPDSDLIIVPKDKKEEIQKLVDDYLRNSWFKNYSKS